MNVKITILGLTVLVVVALFLLSKLQFDETIVSAKYEMLACESCYHMTVEKSEEGSLDGETIIPVSKRINIEQLMGSIAITKESVCLRGRLYRFNWNFFNIDPKGKKFEVIERMSPTACSRL